MFFEGVTELNTWIETEIVKVKNHQKRFLAIIGKQNSRQYFRLYGMRYSVS